MSDKLKIEIKEAAGWMKKGYEIECYVLIAPVAADAPRKPSKYVAASASIGLSLDGTEPSKGELREVWCKLKEELWGSDPTLTYPRAVVDKLINKLAPKKSWIFSNLEGRLKCIRVVKP